MKTSIVFWGIVALTFASTLQAQRDIGVSLIESPQPEYCGTELLTPTVWVKNYGTQPVKSFTVVYRLDFFPLVEKQFDAEIFPGDSAVVVFDAIAVNSGQHAIQFRTMYPDGEVDINLLNDSKNLSFSYAAGKQVLFELMTDAFGNETSWELFDPNNIQIATGGSYASNTLYSLNLCLTAGCYHFIIYDTYGDGICAGYGDGFFRFTDTETSEVLATGCNFTHSTTADFCIAASAGPPVANFSKSALNDCSGSIQFYDNSLCNPPATSWLWDFGDGSTSTLQHPQHTYHINGFYTIALQVTNAFGNHTLSIPNYVLVNRSLPEHIDDVHFCEGDDLVFSADNPDTDVFWYTQANQTNYVHTGNSFTIASPTENTTVFYENITSVQATYFGLKDNSGAGGFFNFNIDRAIYFNAICDMSIVSAKVFASGSGNRTIILKNSEGTVLDTRIINIANGESRIDLNFQIAQGNSYAIHVSQANNLSFTGDYGGPNIGYPFTVPGIISITGNNYSNSFYYFFYDIEVHEGFESTCITARVPVHGIISPSQVSLGDNNVICYGSSIQLAPEGSFNSYNWSTGDNSESIVVSEAGLYSISVVDMYGCKAQGNIELIEGDILLYSANSYNTSTPESSDGGIDIVVTQGNGPFQIQWSNGSTAFSIQNLTAGLYSFTITDANNCEFTGEIIVEHNVAIPTTLLEAGIQIYPNPCTDAFTVITAENRDYSCELLDVNGKPLLNTCLSQANSVINLRNFGSGVYFVRIRCEQYSVMYRVVKL